MLVFIHLLKIQHLAQDFVRPSRSTIIPRCQQPRFGAGPVVTHMQLLDRLCVWLFVPHTQHVQHGGHRILKATVARRPSPRTSVLENYCITPMEAQFPTQMNNMGVCVCDGDDFTAIV